MRRLRKRPPDLPALALVAVLPLLQGSPPIERDLEAGVGAPPSAHMVATGIHAADRAEPRVLLDAMASELKRSFETLEGVGETKLYYLGYALTDVAETRISATLGAIERDDSTRDRFLDVDVRVGGMAFDNTRESRTLGNVYWQEDTRAPLDDDPLALRIALWQRTDRAFKDARERLENLRTEAKLESRREDASGDFSGAEPVRVEEPLAEIAIDLDAWRERLRRYSALFRAHPDIVRSRVELLLNTTDRYLVTSEGSRLLTSAATVRLVVYGWAKAEDGMELYLYEVYDKSDPEALPSEAEIVGDLSRLITNLKALRTAPLVDPYTGPAILQSRASGVFFHEIFGHRVEGHRQKSEQEGQTFTAKVGEEIMPRFLDVFDDPTLETYAGEDLKGHYVVDDEGVPARRVDLVKNGVLGGFLMSRSPVDGFPASNGHGRREHGYRAVARQGNLIVESSKSVPYPELRRQLVDLIRQENKPYGLIFTDISGGFTLTGRALPQSFKVEPLMVYRVYPDGRPDELVRGVDLVGTPLTSLAKILATGDDPSVFDGYCGAESGSVPVSAVAPSLLIAEIEVEKRLKSLTAPPTLPAPPLDPPAHLGTGDVALSAMRDELDRSMSRLRLPESGGPYYMNYRLMDRVIWRAWASFGALQMDRQDRSRYLTTTVRVGDTTFDNTLFVGVNRGLWRPDLSQLPLENDYGAVRRGIWLATDSAYKEAVTHLAAKQAFVRNRVVSEGPNDFSEAEPAVLLDRRSAPALDRDLWRERIRRVSARFRKAAVLEEGRIHLKEERATRRIVDSDGATVLAPVALYELILSVQARAEDGSRLSDYRTWRATVPDDLPGEGELLEEAEGLITEMTALLEAPQGDPYVGPMLLVDQASGEFFAQLLAAELADPRPPLLEEEAFSRFYDTSGAMGKRLNRRILPSTFQVVDDPTRMTWGGTSLLGYYRVDDEGVEARRLDLVRDGWLRNLPMSRTPIRDRSGSNGHGRAVQGRPVQGKPSTLLIHTSAPEPLDVLYERLREQARLSQSPYGILVTRLSEPAVQARVDREGLVQQRVNEVAVANPLLCFRVYAEDGRIEPVRGYRFDEIRVRTLKDILGASGRENLVQTLLDGLLSAGVPISVVAPDVLLEEVVLTPVSGRRSIAPYLARPLPE